jgi:hypothetical protein
MTLDRKGFGRAEFYHALLHLQAGAHRTHSQPPVPELQLVPGDKITMRAVPRDSHFRKYIPVLWLTGENSSETHAQTRHCFALFQPSAASASKALKSAG